MQPILVNKRIAGAVSFLLIFLFVYTAASKLLQLEVFRFHLQKAPYLAFAAPFLAWLVPLLEIGLSVLLLQPFTRRAGLWGSLLLLGSFTLYLAAMLLLGNPLPCSCGGVVGLLGWKEHVLFNTLFILLCAIALHGKKDSTRQTAGIQKAAH